MTLLLMMDLTDDGGDDGGDDAVIMQHQVDEIAWEAARTITYIMLCTYLSEC